MASTQGQSRNHECALCMTSLHSPRLLPCFHTFCVGCLQWLVQSQGRSGTFPCPTCRTTVDIPPGGVEKFQVSLYIEAEGQDTGSSAGVCTCEICRNNPASHKCTECDQLACDTCTAIHASFATTRSHIVLKLKCGTDSAHIAAKVTKERYCAKHKEEKIRFFCNQCSTVICRDCKLTSHDGHAATDLSAKSSEAKQLILQVTNRFRKNLEPKLRQRLRDAGDHQKTVPKKKKEILALLEKRAEELKFEIDKSLSQVKQQLDQETGSLDTTITTCIDSMNAELAAFISLTEHAERIAKSGCEVDILEMPRQMREFFQDEGAQHSTFVQKPVRMGSIRAPHRSQTKAAHTPSCKLKSFIDSKWKAECKLKPLTDSKSKAVAQMQGKQCECLYCSYCHDKKLTFCPNCGESRKPQIGLKMLSSLNRAGNKQCGSCLTVYAQHLQKCPNCEAAGDDVKATLLRGIPEYIGGVTRIEPEEEDSNAAATQLVRAGYWDTYSSQLQPVKKTTNSLGGQIIQEINTIQSSLSKWPGKKKVKQLSGREEYCYEQDESDEQLIWLEY